MALDVRCSTMLLNFCNIQSIQLGVAVSTDKKNEDANACAFAAFYCIINFHHLTIQLNMHESK